MAKKNEPGLGLFDFLGTINHSKKNLIRGADNEDLAEKSYNPWFVNVGLSYFPDTIFQANEMNINHHLPKKLQYEYFLNSIRRRKRFAKWIKKSKIDQLEMVQNYFGYNKRKAAEALKLLTDSDLEYIESTFYTGGN